MTKETKPAAFKLLTQAETGTLITRIKTNGTKLDKDIQTALQCSAIHAHQHGDIGLIERLLAALPKGTRSNAVKEWLVQYAPVIFDGEKIAFHRVYEQKDEAARALKIKAVVEATVWTELKPEPAFKPFILEDALAAVLKKAEAAQKDKEHEGEHSIDPVVLAKVRELLAA